MNLSQHSHCNSTSSSDAEPLVPQEPKDEEECRADASSPPFALSSPTESLSLEGTSAEGAEGKGDSIPELIPAQAEHLAVGRTVYVRGQRAFIVELDFPNVFWCCDGSELIKHRSFLADPKIFQVPAGTSADAGPNAATHQEDVLLPISDVPDLSSSNLFDNDDGDDNIAMYEPDARQQPEPPAPAPALGGIMGMLQRRAAKTEYINELSADVDVSAAFPSGLHISQCEDSRFRVANKVAHISMHDCSDTLVAFPSVISSIELMKCENTTLSCSVSFGTLTVESSEAITIEFPAACTEILVVCTSAHDVRLKAISDDGRVEGEHVVSVDDDAEAVREAAEEGGSQVPFRRVQLRTRWDGAEFNTERIQRHGSSGHIRNLQ